jgi:hypothetical protein
MSLNSCQSANSKHGTIIRDSRWAIEYPCGQNECILNIFSSYFKPRYSLVQMSWFLYSELDGLLTYKVNFLYWWNFLPLLKLGGDLSKVTLDKSDQKAWEWLVEVSKVQFVGENTENRLLGTYLASGFVRSCLFIIYFNASLLLLTFFFNVSSLMVLSQINRNKFNSWFSRRIS